MTFAVAMMILFVGLGDGAHSQMIRSATESYLGQIQVQLDGYQDSPDLEHLLSSGHLAQVDAALKGMAGVKAHAPRLATGALISKKVPEPEDPDDLEAYRRMTSEGAFVVGVDPKAEREVSTLVQSVIREGCSDKSRTDCPPGRFLDDEDPYPDNPYMGQMVLGVGLAGVLDVEVGDTVALNTGGVEGRTFASLYRVVGLVKTGSLDINRTFALTHFSKLAAGMSVPGAASYVVVAIDDLDSARELALDLQARLDGQSPRAAVSPFKALSWRELSPELDVFVKLDQGSTMVTLVMLVMIVGVILANVVTMSSMERTREYGVRMAVGESPRRITWGLVTETVLLALLSGAVGSVLGEAANSYYQFHGIDFGMGEFEMTGVVLSTVYNTEVTLYGWAFSVGTVLFFAVVGAIYPAWKVSRLSPVDAIRFV